MTISHRHNDLELNLVEGGAMSYFFGGRRFTIPAGALVLFWAVAPHQLAEVEPSTHAYWLTVPLNWFLHCIWPEAFRRAVLNCALVFDRAARPSDRALFAQWQADLQAGAADRREIVLLEVEARLKRLAAQMEIGPVSTGPQPPATSASGSHFGQAERIAAYLANNYHEPLHVEDAAGAVGLHPNYAMTIFRRAYGQTVIEYLTQLRVAHAQQLLVNTNHTIIEVAMRSGFGSLSQFYAAFKRMCGVSPRAFRDSLE